jgi:D-sedoheptulose 7-phosphate isomerase
MLEQRIQQQFFDSADLQYRSAEVLLRPIADAAAALLSAITGGGKVMVCGSGAGAALASTWRACSPAALNVSAAAGRAGLGHPPAQEIRALGLPGDVLLYIDDGEGHSAAAISAAQAKDMTIVVLAGRGAAAFDELLAETDVLVAVPHEQGSRVAELQLLVLHCLCDAVDFQLLGDQAT